MLPWIYVSSFTEYFLLWDANALKLFPKHKPWTHSLPTQKKSDLFPHQPFFFSSTSKDLVDVSYIRLKEENRLLVVMKYSSMHICCVEENLYTSIWQTGRATCELPGGLCMMGVRWVSHPIGLSLLAVCWAPSHLRVFEGVVMSELSQLHSAWGHTDCSSYWRTQGEWDWNEWTILSLSFTPASYLPLSLTLFLPHSLFSLLFSGWRHAYSFSWKKLQKSANGFPRNAGTLCQAWHRSNGFC